MNRFLAVLKAINQLGLQPVGLNGLYRLGLASGWYRFIKPLRGIAEWSGEIQPSFFPLPAADAVLEAIGEQGKALLLAEADEIVSGKVRLFGGEPVALILALGEALQPWTAYERGCASLPFEKFSHLPAQDVKFIWEGARFGWAFTLGRAWHLSGDEKYPRAFWQYFESFSDANPPFRGPHWMSAQEAALRLMAFAWAGLVFQAAESSTPERKRRLAAAVAAHAARIPPTMIYARSQQNNHVLTEAAGLLTAALALPGHPRAARWRSLGWRTLNRGLCAQIDGYGEYSQHSTNYQRLMLQVVLWVHALCRQAEIPALRWPHRTSTAVTRATHWLLALMDADSGCVPNLGANDSAYIFPFTVLPHADYRPVLHAAVRAFLDYDLPHGVWDEMGLWLGVRPAGLRSVSLPRYLGDQLYSSHSWATLRTAQFTHRPSHADQLHFDLWWRSLNVARDAGTYLYNAPAPWENSLTATAVHNTVTINGKGQMTRIGRFLFVDWVDAYRLNLRAEDSAVLQMVRGRLRANGFRHTRIVSVFEGDRWRVEDEILPLPGLRRKRRFTARLHWLLPDWGWALELVDRGVRLRLDSPRGFITLAIHHTGAAGGAGVTLVRAGEALHGAPAPDPICGWVSTTYGVKQPALSLAVEAESNDEVKFTSEFIFPQ